MPEETMPAIEAQEGDTADEDVTGTVASYECAFHILPTVADEEVGSVIDRLKALIARSGGAVTDEEISERYDLAYEIIQPVDGVNRRFSAAHFGWIRFMLSPDALAGVAEEMKRTPEILRYLIIRLTREEVRKPFSIFETRRAQDRLHTENTKDETDTSDGAR